MEDDLGDLSTGAISPKRTIDEVNVENNEAARPSKRARKQSACQRCRSRKQGCDNIFPACKNCQKAKTECIRPPESLSNSNGSNEALRDRIAELESRLATYEKVTPTVRKPSNAGPGLEQRPFSPPESAHGSSAGSATVAIETPSKQKNIADVVGFLSLGAEPTYIGPSSGFSMAANLSEMVQATVWNKILASAASSEKPGSTLTFAEMRRNCAGPPEDTEGLRILEAYWTRVHRRYPFLVRKDLHQIHQERYQTPTTVQQQFNHFKLYMVYAIGSTMLKLTEPYDATPPEKFFMTALQYISAARESHSMNNVIAMTLLVIYHLRSPSHTGIWYMIGLAMRTCLDLGLHREAHYARLDPFSAEVKRRLFWSIYQLERIIAIALGRPISVQDRDIDVQLPLDIDDATTDPGKILQVASQQRLSPQNQTTSHPSLKPRPLPPSTPTVLSSCIHLTRLKRNESRILSTIYRVDVPPRTLIPEIAPLLSLLDEWRSRIPSPIPSADNTYLLLQYHKAVRLLLQPFLSLLPISSPYHATCLNSSGQICQIFKRMHSVEAYGHSFVAVHSVFVAGVTICYCLWLSPHLWSFSTSNSLRACSSVLHVIAERTAAVKKYRDVFEELIDATMECMERKRRDVARMKMPMGLGGSGTPGGKTNWLWRDDDIGNDNSNFGMHDMGLDADTTMDDTGFGDAQGTTSLHDLGDLDEPFERFKRTSAWEAFAQGLDLGTDDFLTSSSSTHNHHNRQATITGSTTTLAGMPGSSDPHDPTNTTTTTSFTMDTPPPHTHSSHPPLNNTDTINSTTTLLPTSTGLVHGEDAEVGRMLMGMMSGTGGPDLNMGSFDDGVDIYGSF